ncbi:MAG TPA: GxxExxY protein [Dokdonella sp.]|nr:GxxExxY protein [Dokdonella sp.]
MEFDGLSRTVIGSAIEVHRQLGPGLLESVYRRCLAHELSSAGLSVEAERAVGIRYKGIDLACGFRIDILVERSLVVEIKAVEAWMPVHDAQVLTYLKLAGLKTGLLLNFNCRSMRHGIRRIVL